jgi:hypothetical protein
MTTKNEQEDVLDDDEEINERDGSIGEIVGNILAQFPAEKREQPEATPDEKTVKKDGIEYSCVPVRHKFKVVGFAPTKVPQGETYDDQLEYLTNEYGSESIVKCFVRQNKQDAMNDVRAKYNKDKVSATTVINAIGSGAITPEMQQKAADEVKSGKYKTFTDACAAYIGVGEDALKNADPEHIHWDCAR